MKVKVSEATTLQIDWMVLEALGNNSGPLITYEGNGRKWITTQGGFTINYAENWAQGGPIIEREFIDIRHFRGGTMYWEAWTPAPERRDGEVSEYGPTPLIAAMRCLVTSKLGDTVEIPEELCQS